MGVPLHSVRTKCSLHSGSGLAPFRFRSILKNTRLKPAVFQNASGAAPPPNAKKTEPSVFSDNPVFK